MKYSITVLQAEVKRFENGIKIQKYNIKFCKDDKTSIKNISHCKSLIKDYEKGITELKADIKKL